MQLPATKCEIQGRVKALNLSLKRLARLAEIDPATAYRGPSRIVTHSKVMRALEAEELRLLRHLIELHGVPEDLRRSAA